MCKSDKLTGQESAFICLLSHTLSFEDGQLTVLMSEAEKETAKSVSMTFLAGLLGAALQLSSAELDAICRQHSDVVRALLNRAVAQRVAAPLLSSKRMRIESLFMLKNTFLVAAFLIGGEDRDYAVTLLDSAQQMGLHDMRLFSLRAQLKCFRLNAQDKAVNAVKEQVVRTIDEIVSDCDIVLSSDPANCSAIFAKAFALRSNPVRAERKRCIPSRDISPSWPTSMWTLSPL